MTDISALQDRVERLETTLAHHEHTIGDLDRVVVDQWKVIDDLSRRVRALTEQILEFEQRGGQSRPSDPPPPHY